MFLFLFEIVFRKKINLANCNHVDGTRGYYAKGNKSIRERIIMWFHSYREFKKTEEHWRKEGRIK